MTQHVVTRSQVLEVIQELDELYEDKRRNEWAWFFLLFAALAVVLLFAGQDQAAVYVLIPGVFCKWKMIGRWLELRTIRKRRGELAELVQ